MKRIAPMLMVAVLVLSCADAERNNNASEELAELKAELAHLKNVETEKPVDGGQQLATFFTFQENNAEEAMNFYVSLFENSKITEVQRHGPDGPGKEGSIFYARFELNGAQYACSDSPIKHEWTFTPGVSTFVECKSEEEIETLFAKLSENGQVMMPLANYGWSQKFGFVEDRFGVSWQLNLQ